MNQQTGNVSWDRSHHSYFEYFALDLQDFTKTHKLPLHGSQDVNHGLELQKDRHQEKNIRMKYEFVPRGHFSDRSPFRKSWSDEHYVSTLECRSCQMIRTFFRNQKKVHEYKKNMLFYQVITNVNNGDAVAEDLYPCPACGAISKIGALQNGCPYCGTFFEMKELFPKITNFYFIEDTGGTKQEVKHEIRKKIIPCAVVSTLALMLYFFFGSDQRGHLFYALISGTIGGIVMGAIYGYLWWALGMLGGLFINAGKSIPMLIGTVGSGGRFVSQMRRYSPEFSFEYFSDKMVSILKMLVYAKDPQELPYYVGEPLGNLFSDIIDSSYSGAVALKRFQVQGEYCYVTVDIYMEDIYDRGNRIFEKRDTIRMYLQKSIRKPIDYNFSIERIQCKNCGGSFNAAMRRACPNCGSRYEIGDDDWVVLKVVKIK